MSSYRPIDSKREEFRKYLERTGVIDALTKALVALYEEADKPEDALGYIQSYLGGGGGSSGGSGISGGGNGSINDESSRALQKQMEDLKLRSDKLESNVIKGSGDQPNVSQKLDDTIKTGVSNPIGGEGDASTLILKDGGDIGVPGKEEAGIRIAESIPPEGVA